jgi:hypothetical protein
METLDHFLQDQYLLWVDSVPGMNKTNFANQKFVYNFHSIHFSVGRVLIIGSASEKKVQNFFEV